MLKNIEKLLCILGNGSGVDRDTLRRCLEKAIEQAVCEYFGVQDCEVDLNQQTVDLDLYGGFSSSLYKHIKGRTQKIQANGVMEVKLSLLPPSVISRCEELFRAFMDGAKADMLERRWRRRVHSFPAALVRKLAPWVKVKATRRVRGKKTWLLSDTSLERPTVLAVQKELRGEVIEVKSRLISEAIHFHHQERRPDRSYAARPFFWPEEIS